MLNTRGVREYNTIKYTFYVLKYVYYLYFNHQKTRPPLYLGIPGAAASAAGWLEGYQCDDGDASHAGVHRTRDPRHLTHKDVGVLYGMGHGESHQSFLPDQGILRGWIEILEPARKPCVHSLSVLFLSTVHTWLVLYTRGTTRLTLSDVLMYDSAPQLWYGEGSTIGRLLSGNLPGSKGHGMACISNLGNWANWTGHVLVASNTYGCGRLGWDPTLSSGE